MAKKKISELTLAECKKFCNNSGNEFDSCAGCPLTQICYVLQDTNFGIPDIYLEEEVEVE